MMRDTLTYNKLYRMNSLSDFFSSFKNATTSGSAVGIDVGSSSIKVVEVEEKNNVLKLLTYGELQLGPYGGKELGQAIQLEPNLEQEALVDVIRESAVTGKGAVLAMPLSASFVTNVSLEAEDDVDLAPMVRVEARKVIPASLSEVTLDWAEVESPKQSKAAGHRRDVLIAAIQNAALDRFKVLMQFAGFTKPPTEIECFSSIRSVFDSDQLNTAVIDLGARSSKLYIARDALLMRMHRVRAGGAIATDSIAKSLEMNFAEAEERKLTVLPDDKDFADIKRAHDVTYERAFREFRQVLREYEQKTGITIDVVYLAGGGSLFPGMAATLKDALNKDVELSNPFARVAHPAFLTDTLQEIGPSFVVSLGAALRNYE